MVDGVRARGHRVDVVELDASFPHPTAAALGHADRELTSLAAGTMVLVDSLALGAMPDLIVRDAARLAIVALMHLPLAVTFGLDRDTAIRFEAGERRALHATSLVVVTGTEALLLLARYDLPAERIVVVEPGTDRVQSYVASGFSRTSSRTSPLELLCVGTLNAIKGHDILIEALAGVPSRDWHLTCAGSLTRDPGTADRVRTAIARLGLADRVTLAGDLDRDALAACYHRADLFVLATRQETYGMAVADALAHGLPVVATMTGAMPELVGSEAGVLVPVGDTASLAAALTRVIGDEELRARLAEGARRVRDRLPTWDEAAGRMAAALASIDAHG